MKKTNKFVAALSIAAISTLISSVAFAADGDMYQKTDLTNIKYNSNDLAESTKLQKKVTMFEEDFGYEHNGKIYSFEEVNTLYMNKGSNIDATLKALESNEIKEIATVEAPDKEAPVLVYDGKATIELKNGAEFTVPEVTAKDNKDEKVEVKHEIKNAEGKVIEAIDTKVAGTYTITYTAKDAAGNEAEAKVITVKVAEDKLAVESVSAINENGITVKITKLTEDKVGATVVVKDSKGDVVEVEAQDLSAGEETVEFTFVTPVKSADLEGIWTVDGIKFNLSLVNQLLTFEETNSQIELYEVLNELGIQNVESANAAAYLAYKGDFLDKLVANDKELTVETIQAYVNDVNAKQVTEAEKETAAKAVFKALGNNIELKEALNNKAFTKVNNAWIENVTSPSAVHGYATELAGAGLAEATVTVAQVQAEIDTVNEAVIVAQILDVNPATSVDKTKMSALKTLIETYAPVDTDGNYVTVANKKALDNIAKQSAVADVLAATTASKFKSTVTNLADIANTPGTSDVIDMKDYVDANGKAYIDTIKDLNSTAPTLTPASYGVTGKVDSASEIASIITKVNDVEKDKVAVKEYKNLKDAATALKTPANVTATNKVKYISALQAVGIKQVSSNTANVAKYIDTDGSTLTLDLILAEALKVDELSKVQAAKTAIQGIVDKANVTVVKESDATSIIAALNVLELKNVTPANAAKYVADTGTNGVMNATEDNVAKIQIALDKVNTSVNVENAVKAINDATTAEEVKVALDTLANEGEVAGYLNVTTADRIFIAEQVLKLRTKEYQDKLEVGTAVTAATNARTGTLIAVNKLKISDNLTTIADDLLLVGHDSLTGKAGSVTVTGVVTAGTPTANDTVVADKFITSVGFDDNGDITPQFRSISEIRAAITNAVK